MRGSCRVHAEGLSTASAPSSAVCFWGLHSHAAQGVGGCGRGLAGLAGRGGAAEAFHTYFVYDLRRVAQDGRAARRPLHTLTLGMFWSVVHTKVCSRCVVLQADQAVHARPALSHAGAFAMCIAAQPQLPAPWAPRDGAPPPNLAPRHGRVKNARCVKETRPARPIALLLWAIAGGGLNWRSPAAGACAAQT